MKKGKVTVLLLGLLSLFLAAGAVWALPTTVTVRVQAHDAKFIGTSAGGLQISIYDVASGKLLATGPQAGGTGSTHVLMEQPRKRGQRLAAGDTAGYTAHLQLEEPRLVRIEARGPGANDHPFKVSQTLWLLPGQQLTDDGVVLNLQGLMVNALAPHANKKVTAGKPLELRAFVSMLCGCGIKEQGHWPADDYQVKAWIYHKQQRLAQVPLDFTGETGMFAGQFVPEEAGAYHVYITAQQQGQSNTGVAQTGFSVK